MFVFFILGSCDDSAAEQPDTKKLREELRSTTGMDSKSSRSPHVLSEMWVICRGVQYEKLLNGTRRIAKLT
jgi:hypothetical protein